MKEAYMRAKGECVRMFDHAQGPEAKAWWAKRIEWLDKKLSAQQSNQPSKIKRMNRLKMLIWIINITVILQIVCCTGCTTVQGIGTDITWMGRAGQQALEHGHKLK